MTYAAYPIAPTAPRAPYPALAPTAPPAPAIPGYGFTLPTLPAGTFATPTGYGAATLDSYAPVRMAAPAAAELMSAHSLASSVARVGMNGSRSARSMAMGASGGIGIGKALGLSALLSAPLILFTDYMAYRNGSVTAAQRNTLMAADLAGYTAAGAAGSLIGTAMIGMGAMGGVIGIAAGVALGFVYERFLRPSFTTGGGGGLPK